MSRIVVFSILLGAAGGTFAADTAPVLDAVRSTDMTTSTATQHLRGEVQKMLTRMGASGALGSHPERLNLDFTVPARRAVDLGLLVDATSAANARDGLRVLGTTPDSTAEHLGVHPGDVIVAVNGHSLRELGTDNEGRALAATALKASVDDLSDEAPLQLDVRRNGMSLALNGTVRSVQLPALRVMLGAAATTAAAPPPAPVACGHIGLIDLAPRQQKLYGATVLLVDGVSPGPSGASRYRVTAGIHELSVGERIPTQVMGMGALPSLRRNQAKPLSVTVKPNTTVLIAARFNETRASELNNGGYWDPIAWKEVDETCP